MEKEIYVNNDKELDHDIKNTYTNLLFNAQNTLLQLH